MNKLMILASRLKDDGVATIVSEKTDLSGVGKEHCLEIRGSRDRRSPTYRGLKRQGNRYSAKKPYKGLFQQVANFIDHHASFWILR